MPMITDPRIETLWRQWQDGPMERPRYLAELSAILAERAREHPDFEEQPYTPTDGDGRLIPVSGLPGKINFYKWQERFGFIGWDGTPDYWFTRDGVADPELKRMLDNRDLYLSGTAITFQGAGITRDGEKRPTAINIRLRT